MRLDLALLVFPRDPTDERGFGADPLAGAADEACRLLPSLQRASIDGYGPDCLDESVGVITGFSRSKLARARSSSTTTSPEGPDGYRMRTSPAVRDRSYSAGR